MKQLFFAAALLSALATPALAADVGVSVSIGQPGFYGQIDLGDFPRPQVVYRQPRLIERGSYRRPPIYMNVPPQHARNWRRHCDEYNACGERVYFVRNSWYDRQFVPHYQQRHGEGRYEEHRGRGRHGRDGRGGGDYRGYNH